MALVPSQRAMIVCHPQPSLRQAKLRVSTRQTKKRPLELSISSMALVRSQRAMIVCHPQLSLRQAKLRVSTRRWFPPEDRETPPPEQRRPLMSRAPPRSARAASAGRRRPRPSGGVQRRDGDINPSYMTRICYLAPRLAVLTAFMNIRYKWINVTESLRTAVLPPKGLQHGFGGSATEVGPGRGSPRTRERCGNDTFEVWCSLRRRAGRFDASRCRSAFPERRPG